MKGSETKRQLIKIKIKVGILNMGRKRIEDVQKKCVICGNVFTTRGDKRGLKRKTCSRSCSAKLGQKNNRGETTCKMCNTIIIGSKSAISAGLPQYCKECTKHRYINTCKECGKEFRSKKKVTQYCSHECEVIGRRLKVVDVECDYCGKKFKRPTFSVYKGKNVYCSKRCGYNHYSIMNPSRYGGTWARRKKEILERDNFKCLICGETEDLEQHHFIKIKTFNDPNEAHYDDNVGTFCKKHHREVENKYHSLKDFYERYSPNSSEN